MAPGICYALAIVCAAVAACRPGLVAFVSSRKTSSRSWNPGPVPLLGTVLAVIPAAMLGYCVSEFYQKHWSGISPGSVRYGAERELAGYHGLLCLVLLVGAVAVVWHLFRARGAGRVVAGTSGILAAALAIAALVNLAGLGLRLRITAQQIAGPAM